MIRNSILSILVLLTLQIVACDKGLAQRQGVTTQNSADDKSAGTDSD
jgi:hypothetical protein